MKKGNEVAEEEVGVLFPSEYAYRVVTALLACVESGYREILIPDIAYKVKIPYGSVLYWINKFEIYGLVRVTRYENRENANCMNNRHIVVHLTNKKMLGKLYNYMWIQKWEDDLKKELVVGPQLKLVERKAA